jgi:hypothetical protein
VITQANIFVKRDATFILMQHLCYLFLGFYKKKKIQKIYIKKYSKEILKIIGARKGC